MSQSPPNYMENIPVKISERYKPPPKVSLPQSVCQRLNTDEFPSLHLTYDFSLEKNVLRQIDEWKKVREQDRDNRRERIRKREIERVKQMEAKQKQLLTNVSYPSAEELSSDDDDNTKDDEAEGSSLRLDDSVVSIPQQQSTTVAVSVAATMAQCSPSSQQRFDTILTPTIVPDDYNHATYNSSVLKTSLSKINYSDFENDTSSPFDNIELKTINDLDILAQVLNITQLHSTSTAKDGDPNEIHDLGTNRTNNVSNHHKDDLYSPSTNNDNRNTATRSDQSGGGIYEMPASSQNANHFYAATAYNHQSIQNNVNMNGTAEASDFYYYQHHRRNYDNFMYSNVNYSMNPLAERGGALTATAGMYQLENTGTLPLTFAQNEVVGCDAAAIMQQPKSKSKSVPDILKELNAEIRDSEIRRTRNHSQTIENCENKTVNNATVVLPNRKSIETFMKLSPSSQSLAENISSMGFPLERVSRIAERFGNDDKKIVEHLIPLSELLDLGFDESRISDALLKFDNNKEKALDFLIS